VASPTPPLDAMTVCEKRSNKFLPFFFFQKTNRKHTPVSAGGLGHTSMKDKAGLAANVRKRHCTDRGEKVLICKCVIDGLIVCISGVGVALDADCDRDEKHARDGQNGNKAQPANVTDEREREDGDDSNKQDHDLTVGEDRVLPNVVS